MIQRTLRVHALLYQVARNNGAGAADTGPAMNVDTMPVRQRLGQVILDFMHLRKRRDRMIGNRLTLIDDLPSGRCGYTQ